MFKIRRSIIVIVLVIFFYLISLVPIPVSALQAGSFSEWFPLPLNVDALAMLVVTVLLVMAGTVAGITIKELEILKPDTGNPTPRKLLTYENKLFLVLGGALSAGFWISHIPAFDCFLYSTMLKASLGTLRNYMTKKQGK